MNVGAVVRVVIGVCGVLRGVGDKDEDSSLRGPCVGVGLATARLPKVLPRHPCKSPFHASLASGHC